MNSKDLLNKIIPPCSKCPYKLGQVETLKNPCPECKLNNYRTYETFKSMAGGQKIPPDRPQQD